MGRRRLWIIVGATGLLVIAFLVRGLLIPTGPLRFLEGLPPAVPGAIFMKSGTDAVYSFPTNVARFAAAAKTELQERGYVEISEGLWFAPKGTSPRLVEIRPNYWYSSTWGSSNKPRDGWVLVRLTGFYAEPLTLWERIKAVFGL